MSKYWDETLELTKLERFTLAAMQGICSNPDYCPNKPEHFKNVAEDAINQACATLDLLEQYK